MRAILGVVVGATLVASTPAAAQPQPIAASKNAEKPSETATPVDPASLALAHQILAIEWPPEKRAKMYDSMMDSIVEQTRKTLENKDMAGDKDFQAMVDHSTVRMFDEMKASIIADLPDYFGAMEHAYARQFSPDDLRSILAFVKTPAGQHYFQRIPEVLKDPDMQAANQRLQSQLLGKMPEIQREAMKDVADYIAKKEKQAKPTAAPSVS
jgi:hypothetical protein